MTESETTNKRKRCPGGGRKPILDEADRKFLSDFATEHPYSTLPELQAELAKKTGKKVSPSTIDNALKEMGFQRIKRKKASSAPAPQTPPRYTEEHRREPGPGKYPSSLTDAEWKVVKGVLDEVQRQSRTQADPCPSTDDGRGFLPCANWLPVADAPQGFPSVEGGVEPVPNSAQ